MAKIIGGRVARDVAFELFNQGKRPSDREVKATKIKSQILYRYYQEWKRLSSNNKS